MPELLTILLPGPPTGQILESKLQLYCFAARVMVPETPSALPGFSLAI